MPMLVRAFPLQKPLAELQAFAASLRAERRLDAAAFYRQFGVTHESWHVQQTPTGSWVISVTKLDDAAEAAPRYAASSKEFDAWFKDQVRSLCGVDPDAQPLGPPTTEVFAWSDDQRANSNLCA